MATDDPLGARYWQNRLEAIVEAAWAIMTSTGLKRPAPGEAEAKRCASQAVVDKIASWFQDEELRAA